MPHITTCPQCSKCYEECSEEFSNYPGRLCNACFEKKQEEKKRVEEVAPELLSALEELTDAACKVHFGGAAPSWFNEAIGRARAAINKARKGT